MTEFTAELKVTESVKWITVYHDEMKFMFEKLDATTAQYRYAYDVYGGANSERTMRYDLPEHPSDKDIPVSVIEQVEDRGFTVR